jgi:hypothetical protein
MQPKDSQHSQRLNILANPRNKASLTYFRDARFGRHNNGSSPCYAVMAYDMRIGYTRCIARFYFDIRESNVHDVQMEQTARDLANDFADAINLQN